MDGALVSGAGAAGAALVAAASALVAAAGAFVSSARSVKRAERGRLPSKQVSRNIFSFYLFK